MRSPAAPSPPAIALLPASSSAATLLTSWASSCGTTLSEMGAEIRARSRRAAISSSGAMVGREAAITVVPGRVGRAAVRRSLVAVRALLSFNVETCFFSVTHS